MSEHGFPQGLRGRADPSAAQKIPKTIQRPIHPFPRRLGCRPEEPRDVGKAALLEKMQPFKGGGDMILSVTFEKTTYNTIPHKFEAGTPPIAAMIGLGAALDYVSAIGLERIAAHEHALLEYATEQVTALGGVRIIGTAREKAAVLSFYVGDVHPHDVGTLLDEEGVAVRTGHHCAQPVMQRFGVPATARASFAFYNTFAEVDAHVAAIRKVQKLFA